MNYTLDEFQRLCEAVEEQGGALLPEACEPQDIVFTLNDGYIRNKTEKKVTQGCGHESMLVTAYQTEPGAKENVNFVRSCAVCDSMGAWPRYEHVLGDS